MITIFCLFFFVSSKTFVVFLFNFGSVKVHFCVSKNREKFKAKPEQLKFSICVSFQNVGYGGQKMSFNLLDVVLLSSLGLLLDSVQHTNLKPLRW